MVQSESKNTLLLNSYQSPEQMGVDRWCAMNAAVHHAKNSAHKNCNLCVVSAGTAMTVDIICSKPKAMQHLGGYIVPGYRMQVDALIDSTGQINFSEKAEVIATDPGTNTVAAVCSGVIGGMIGLIKEGLLRANNASEQDALLYITGGDAGKLIPQLECRYYHMPDLVLDGIGLVARSQ